MECFELTAIPLFEKAIPSRYYLPISRNEEKKPLYGRRQF